MRKFIQRALEKIDKLDSRQIHNLLSDLATENERLEAVLESMTDGIMVTDVENRLVLYNKAAERYMPFSHIGDVYEKKVWIAIEDSEIAEFVQQTLEKQDTVTDKEFSLTIGGDLRVLSCSVMPLVRYGKIQGSLFHLEEVTEKRTKEARLRRAESLASLTTLAAGVAHEIKNPLGSIGIHIQLMKKNIQGKPAVDPKNITKHLNVVMEEVERLNKIVVDFLFAVRPMDIDLRLLQLNDIVRELLDFVYVELAEESIDLKVALAENLPRLLLDDKYLKQAVLNIVKNAIFAMPKGGVLTVSTKVKGDYVRLSIADNGVGIPKEILGKIFEPYFTTRDFGSGLGLTIVFKIVKEHRAEISVDSRKGKGTTFTISFPVPQRERQLLSYEGLKS
jgi:PAS domain S-box-containing protein